MKRLLITGSHGQLGSTLRELLAKRPDIEAHFTDVADLDITDAGAVSEYAVHLRPDYIINCAAFTAVDKAESEEEKARRINADAVGNLAEAAKAVGARLVHVSTDYVFSGEGFHPWTEEDIPAPRSAYGRTKLLGEQKALNILPGNCLIMRTAWLYSPFGANFVKTMLRLASEREQISVVDDQIGTPTSARTLARAILTVIDAPDWHPGIYHLTDAGAASWYDLAVATLEEAGITNCRVLPIATDQYPTPTRRPAYSLLSKKKFCDTFGVTLPHWRQSLRDCINTIKAN